MLYFYHYIILLFCILAIPVNGLAQASRSLKQVSGLVKTYNTGFPKQKVYLQTDKDSYFQHERIWFKAYVNSGRNWELDTISKNLYVELWSPSLVRVDIVRLKLKNGLARGSLFVSDTLEQGVYQLRAFTDVMLNFAPQFFFDKNIEVHNSNHPFIISSREARKNRKRLKSYKKAGNDFHVELTFEQNRPVEGAPNTIYYKAVNRFGELVNVNGYIISSGKKKIKEFKNNFKGIGKITYTPLAGEKYKIVFVDKNDSNKTYKLPLAEKTGVVGSVYLQSDIIKISLSKPNPLSNDPSANRYFIFGYANNMIYYTGVVDLRGDTVIEFSSNKFPVGIIGFSMLSNRLEPVAAFKVFNYKTTGQAKLKADLIPDQDSISIEVIPNELQVSSMGLSIAISDTFCPSYHNFENNFYIDSDILDTPENRFNFTDSDQDEFLQLFVRSSPSIIPDWHIVLSDSARHKIFKPEKGIEIRGKIVTEIFSIPVSEASVKLEILDYYNDVYSTITGDDGLFGFEGFDFYDTLQMKIIARKKSGRKAVLIELADMGSPEIREYCGSYFLTTQSFRDNKQHRRVKSQQAKEEYVEEEKALNEFYKDVLHGRPDYILYSDELNDDNTVLQAITGRVSGVQVAGNKIFIRGINTILGSTDPLVLVDDVPAEVSILSNIYIRDVDRIEFLKGPSASIYGLRGANGVIAVYTKRGEYMIKGQLEFGLIGYQAPLQFDDGTPEGDVLKDERLPYTLAWIPELGALNGKPFEVKIKKPEVGRYVILKIEGLGNQNQPFSETFSFKMQ
jgi:TonB-dependent SusC/RagA subfamily outer membrane receptor